MGMVLCDEPLGAVPIDLSYFESPIENDATSPVIGHTSQLAAAENLQVKCAQKLLRPLRVFRHFDGKLLMQTFAARLEHPLVTPNLEDLDVLGLTAEHAGNDGMRGRWNRVRHDAASMRACGRASRVCARLSE
jgi:hypothetical protein